MLDKYFLFKAGRYFYTKGDKEIIERLDSDRENWSSYRDINKLVELYILCEKIYPSKYNDDVGKTIHKVSDSSIESFYSKYDFLKPEYHYAFWSMVTRYGVKINSRLMKCIEQNKNFSISEIVIHENIAKKTEGFILNRILNSKTDFEHMIRSVLGNQYRNVKEYWPKKLIKQNFERIVNVYISNKDVDTDVFQLILESTEYKTPERTELAIFRKLKRLSNPVNEQVNNQKVKAIISFEQSKKLISVRENSLWCLKLNINYDLLKKCKKLFLFNQVLLPLFLDENFRFRAISRKSELGSIEKGITLHGKNDYEFGMAFRIKNFKESAIIRAIDNKLKENNRAIESSIKQVLEEFFSVIGFKNFYFHEGYDSNDFVLCDRNLCAEIDSIMHQFKHLREYSVIDKDEIKFLRQPLSINNLRSFYPKKNIYLNNDRYGMVFHFLFDDQGKYSVFNLKGISNLDDSYSLFDFILKNDVYECECNSSELDCLVDSGTISIDGKGKLIFDEEELKILNNLYTNEFINYIRADSSSKKILDKLEEKGVTTSDDNSFSKQECDYFNFVMNDKKFGNSLSMRNGYQHGSVSSDDSIIENDYYELLKVLLLVVCKIYDELTLKYSDDF